MWSPALPSLLGVDISPSQSKMVRFSPVFYNVFEGVLDMRMAELEMKRIEEVVNDVVAAMPAEKNPEVKVRIGRGQKNLII